jgi:hypothetical protein
MSDTQTIIYELHRVMAKLQEIERKVDNLDYQLRLLKRDISQT